MFEPVLLVPVIFIFSAILAYVSFKKKWKITKYF